MSYLTPPDNVLNILFQNQTKGLLGTWNFNPFDDFTLPDGNIMNLDRNNFRSLHDFGIFCKWPRAIVVCFSYIRSQHIDYRPSKKCMKILNVGKILVISWIHVL